mgnify:CR=1 FL=1
MNNIKLQDLVDKLKEYNPEEIEIVKKAYNYADNLHSGQIRQSGEPYITHPLNVAYILADMHADRDTICAGLLHDTLEDTNISKEDINPMSYFEWGIPKSISLGLSIDRWLQMLLDLNHINSIANPIELDFKRRIR